MWAGARIATRGAVAPKARADIICEECREMIQRPLTQTRFIDECPRVYVCQSWSFLEVLILILHSLGFNIVRFIEFCNGDDFC